MAKNLQKKNYFFAPQKPLTKSASRIRIRTKMSRIHNTDDKINWFKTSDRTKCKKEIPSLLESCKA
jgi:hypothetical protein